MELGQSFCLSILSQERADTDDIEATAVGARFGENAPNSSAVAASNPIVLFSRDFNMIASLF